MFCPSCHTQNDPATPACVTCRTTLPRTAPGAVIGGRYQIGSCLGAGGMGVVYKAHDRVLDEVVAIKALLHRDEAGGSAARRFLSEIKLARKVTHRNVCRIHDYGEDGGLQYISMQFVEGTDLRVRVRESDGLPAEEAFAVAAQIADGLQAIHDEGIVHRDLKTANVMIDSQGVARLMDFGIAKATGAGESLTGTGHIVGTPDYMSPEQIHGQELDARSDLYSLGVILFELFTGRVPFSAATAVAIMMKHLHEQPPLDGPEARRIPAAAREVIRKALAKEREQRFGSARELATALHEARSASGTPPTAVSPAVRTAPPPPPPPAAPRSAVEARRSRRWGWALGAMAAAVAVPLAVWLAYRLATLLVAGTPSPSPSGGPPVTATGAYVASPAARSSRRTAPPAPSATPPIPTPVSDQCQKGDAASCRQACDQGAATACTHLGILYNRGQGIEKDLATAAELYEKGCTGGDGAGCNNLGTLYEFGVIGFGKDLRSGAGYYRRACDLGDSQGCGNLALVSLDDPDVSGSRREEAIRLLRQACSGNAPRACRKLQELGLPL